MVQGCSRLPQTPSGLEVELVPVEAPSAESKPVANWEEVMMMVTVKALQGRECSLQVSPQERVGVVKQLVAESLQVPVEQQRLLYRGKALADDRSLSDYSIGPSARLNLVLKPPPSSRGGTPENAGGTSPPLLQPPRDPPSASSVPFFGGEGDLAQLLGRHFGAQEVPRILQQLQKDYEQSLRGLSLDDVERLGARMLQPEGGAQ